MKRTHALWTMGLAGALLAGCQQNRVASPRYAAASNQPPTYSRLRIKTDPVPETHTAPLAQTPAAQGPAQAPTAQAPGAQAPGAQAPGAQGPAQGAVSQGFVTETPASTVPHGTTPVNTRPTEAAQPVETPAALPAQLPASKLPAPTTAPATAPTLPPPPVPSSRTAPGQSKGHVDPNGGETIIIMSQSDSSADKSLIQVNNKTASAPAPSAVVNASHSAPKEGVCTITGEAQQFRRTWRLRYAPLDSEDTHGGSVMLLGEGLNRIREGQQIRVVGVMQPAEERGDVPRFQVQFLEILSR